MKISPLVGSRTPDINLSSVDLSGLDISNAYYNAWWYDEEDVGHLFGMFDGCDALNNLICFDEKILLEYSIEADRWK